MTRGVKKLLGAFVLVGFLIIPVSSFADGDTGLHFGLSVIFGAAGETVIHYKTQSGTAERILYGTVLGSLPGLGKELIDSGQKGNHFSGTDMAADVAGAFVGAVIANLVNNKIQISIEKEQKKVSLLVTYPFR